MFRKKLGWPMPASEHPPGSPGASGDPGPPSGGGGPLPASQDASGGDGDLRGHADRGKIVRETEKGAIYLPVVLNMKVNGRMAS